MHAFPRPSCLKLLPVLALAAALAAPACESPVDEQLRADFLAALGETSITVYPAAVHTNALEGSHHDAGAASTLSAWLTGRDLAQVTISDEHVPLTDVTRGYQADVFRATAAAFGAHVVAHPPGTDYALLAEYLITLVPGGGTQAGGIHAFVVDAQGRLVDALLLNSHHELFQQAHATDAAACTEVVIAAFAQDWGVAR